MSTRSPYSYHCLSACLLICILLSNCISLQAIEQSYEFRFSSTDEKFEDEYDDDDFYYKTSRKEYLQSILSIDPPPQTPATASEFQNAFGNNAKPPSFIVERINDLFQTMQSASASQNYSPQSEAFVHKAEHYFTRDNDAVKALFYFRIAAILGHHGARAAIGAILLSGDSNAKRDISAGVNHLRAAAKYGQPNAQTFLAMLHASGIADRYGIEKSLPKALVYWTFAAASGNVYASTSLAFRYLHGLGLPKSCATAAHYYHHAAHSIATDSKFWPTPYNFVHGPPPVTSGLVVVDRLRFDENTFNTANKQDDEQNLELLHYYRHSAKRGDASVQTLLGSMYYFGYGDKPNEELARTHLEHAANIGSAEAHGLLGHLEMRKGNNASAVMHFRRSAAHNDRIGHYALGMIFLHGLLGMEQDYSKARMHFEITTETVPQTPNAQYAGASFELGMLHWREVDSNFDKQRAVEYFLNAHAHGHLQAKLYMGKVYLHGTSYARPNCEEAVKHFKEVAERGEWNTVFDVSLQNIRKQDWYGALYRQLQAAHAGIEIAQYNAAVMLETMDNSSFHELKHWDRNRMLNEAHELYQLSGIQGHTDSFVRSANAMYADGKNYQRAINVYSQAASLKNGESMVTLGLMYARGLGVLQNRQKALRYFQSAAHLDRDSVAPAYVAYISLSTFWMIRDFWQRLKYLFVGGYYSGTVQDELPSPITNHVQHTQETQQSKVKMIMEAKPLFNFKSDALLIGLLLVALLVVLFMRGQRIARHSDSTNANR